LAGRRAVAWWTILVVGVAMVSAYADDLPLPPSGVMQITEERWRALLTRVQSTPDVDCQVVGNTKLYQCVGHRTMTVWTFAMEGNPAFPAVSQAILTSRVVCLPGYSGPRNTISRSGGYAGDQVAFEKFLKVLVGSDEKFVSTGPRCSTPEWPWRSSAPR
jgi:hypothetical protein